MRIKTALITASAFFAAISAFGAGPATFVDGNMQSVNVPKPAMAQLETKKHCKLRISLDSRNPLFKGEAPVNIRIHAEGFLKGEWLPAKCKQFHSACSRDRDAMRKFIKGLEMQVLSYDDTAIVNGTDEAKLVGLDKAGSDNPMGDWLVTRLRQIPDIAAVSVKGNADSKLDHAYYTVKSRKPLTEEKWQKMLEPVQNKILMLDLIIPVIVEVSAQTEEPEKLPAQFKKRFSYEVLDVTLLN
jgi:hypothetical protein